MNTKIFILLILFSKLCFGQKFNNADICSQEEVYLYLNVDKMPTFSYEKLSAMEYIYNNIKWPNEFEWEGTIVVSFIISKNGDVYNTKIERGLCELCDNEVKRIINSMPKWEPGEKNGKPVNVLILIPIRFHMDY
ncbi:MAG TPA: energy transducer TonB [Bacteroidales bacterium]|mgnify:CR=1 FL=1|jgi:protein TonB|nr:energy transducer TonB [Bacteroidales bacterium]